MHFLVVFTVASEDRKHVIFTACFQKSGGCKPASVDCCHEASEELESVRRGVRPFSLARKTLSNRTEGGEEALSTSPIAEAAHAALPFSRG
ncbi:hypothetical protein WM40_20045 [Robbsia andropogonis]|uniref:Uncharacterized protein n=1 Tax=Robbsia andropogonis TaxID=28092 RepID=A0A0F5JWF0_9BURK|nr:hypothetical protein WM40_20045 [Robbsia andropogonis]